MFLSWHFCYHSLPVAADIQSILAEHPHLKDGERKKYWQIDAEKGKITYFLRTKAHTEKLSDPEEWVRSAFLIELLEKYQYMPGFIEFETEMPKRVPNQFADIVIYDEENESPFIAIECKQDGITDAEFEQAVKQGVGNGNVLAAQYSGAVAGSTRRFFKTGKFDPKNPIENTLSDIPRKYGKPEEWKYRKGDREWDLREVTTEELKTILSKCHQTIWRGGKRNPAEAFGEVAKIIFVKIWDEKHLTKRSEYYSFQRKSDEQAEKVKQRIVSIYSQAQKDDPEVFNEDIKLDAEEVTAVVEHLQAISLSRTDLDVKGEAFQRFMGSFFKGDFGQYFTPTPTVKFCMQLFRNDLNNRQKVLDPACGSGGFLLQALDFIRMQANKEFDLGNPKEAQEHFNYWHNFAEHNLFGIEINEAIARVAKMNMILHDDGHTNVIGHDSLDSIEKMWVKNHSFEKEQFDFIFTNPPFGATVKGSEHPYIQHYELAKNGKKKRDNQKSEILFIERCWEFLRPGTGKMAIVLPDGILTNSSLQYVRDWIMDHFQILAVISLPQDAFRYYGAGVKSSVLALRKLGPKDDKKEDYAIFMANPQQIGIDATGRKCKNDLDEVADEYQKFQKQPDSFFLSESDSLFAIKKLEVEGRLDVCFYFPSFLKLEKKVLEHTKKTLSDYVVSMAGGATPTKGNEEYYADAADGIPFLRVQNVSPRGVALEDVKYINKEVHEDMLKRSKATAGDLLVKITGVGRMAVASVVPDGLEANINQHLVVIKTKDRKTSEVLAAYLNTDIAERLASRRSTGGTRPALDYDALLSVPIIYNPKIVETFEHAITESQEKKKQAQEILDSIDKYLMEELRIRKPKNKEQLCFGVKAIKARSYRLDTTAHSPMTNAIKNAIHSSKFKPKPMRELISESVAGEWGEDPNDADLAEKTIIAVLRNTNFDNRYNLDLTDVAKRAILNEKIQRLLVRKGDLLLEKSGGSEDQPVARVAIVTEEIDSKFGFSNFLQKIVVHGINSEFLFCLLKMYHSSGFTRHIQNQTTGIRNVISEEFESLEIPIPPTEMQLKISKVIASRRKEAVQLEKEAVSCVEDAKKEAESMLLS